MEQINKILRYNALLDIYQNLLSKTQKEILIDYFNYDLSLSEIASNRNVSRAAVEDAILKGIKKMESFESELKLFEKRNAIINHLDVIKENAHDKKVVLKAVEEIEKNL